MCRRNYRCCRYNSVCYGCHYGWLTPWTNPIHLQTAKGWLELGNHEEAFEELEKVEAPLRGQPNVLELC